MITAIKPRRIIDTIARSHCGSFMSWTSRISAVNIPSWVINLNTAPMAVRGSPRYPPPGMAARDGANSSTHALLSPGQYNGTHGHVPLPFFGPVAPLVAPREDFSGSRPWCSTTLGVAACDWANSSIHAQPCPGQQNGQRGASGSR